jgi:hypothetical protein
MERPAHEADDAPRSCAIEATPAAGGKIEL